MLYLYIYSYFISPPPLFFYSNCYYYYYLLQLETEFPGGIHPSIYLFWVLDFLVQFIVIFFVIPGLFNVYTYIVYSLIYLALFLVHSCFRIWFFHQPHPVCIWIVTQSQLNFSLSSWEETTDRYIAEAKTRQPSKRKWLSRWRGTHFSLLQGYGEKWASKGLQMYRIWSTRVNKDLQMCTMICVCVNPHAIQSRFST